MYEDLGGHYTNKGGGGHRRQLEQLGALEMTRLDISIAPVFYVRQELEGPRGSSRVVRGSNKHLYSVGAMLI